MPASREFAPYLVSYRTLAGLSQAELARLSGVSKGTIGVLEARHRRGSRLVLFRLAKVLNCSVADLMNRDPEQLSVGGERN